MGIRTRRVGGAFAAFLAVAAVGGIALAAPAGTLEPLKTYVDSGTEDGVALDGAYGTAVSPDGDNVYVIADGTNSIVAFDRAKSGKLTFLQRIDNGDGFGGMARPSAVGITRDGKNVYVTSQQNSAIISFARKGSGKLEYVNGLTDGIGAEHLDSPCCQLTISPDGKNVYVPSGQDSAIAIFKRSKGAGGLTYKGAAVDDERGIEGMDEPIGVTVSRDGRFVYAISTADSSLVALERNKKGGLKYLQTKFDGNSPDKALSAPCCSVLISRDGGKIYVPAEGEAAVGILRRSERTGKVSFFRAARATDPGLQALADPTEALPSRDGKRVWIANYTTSSLISARVEHSGKLRGIDTLNDGDAGVEDISGIWRLTESPDGKNVYSSNYDDDSLTAFKRTK